MTESLFVDRYRLIRQIGSGGMGVVFEAEDQLLKKIVAIKTIKRGTLSSDLIMRFQREAHALAALNHPNLVPIFIFGITDDNQPYLVMQYEQGKPLSELIEARGRLPVYKSINIFLKLASAIQHAHEHGVLHRDLKPSNVILKNYERENPDVILIDFGIAMVANNNSMDSLTKTGILLGTPAYMSPEQVAGKELDERSDIYSLGCVMYETLTGLQPFSGGSALELLSKKTTQNAPSINDAVMDVAFPAALEAIVAKCLEREPSSRYESVRELKSDLQSFKAGDYKADNNANNREKAPTHNPTLMPSPAPLRMSGITVAVILLISLFTGGILLLTIYITSPNNDAKPLETQSPQPKKDFGFGSEPFSFRNGTLYVGGLLGSKIDPEALVANKIKAVAKEEERHGRELSVVCFQGSNVSGVCFEGCEDIPIKEVHAVDVNFTDEGLRAISKLPELEQLSIERGDRFTASGIKFLAKAPLLALSLTECSIDAEKVKAIATFPRLIELDLRGASGLNDETLKLLVKGIPNLRYLGLNETQVSTEGLKSLVQLQGLQQLLLRQIRLTHEGMEAVGRLKHITTLDIKSNDNLTDADIAPLKNVSTLVELNIDSPKISNLALASLKLRNSKLNLNTEKTHSARMAEAEEQATSSKRNLANREELQIPLHRNEEEVTRLLKSEAAKPNPLKAVRAADSDIVGECFKDCPLQIWSLKSYSNKLTNKGLQCIAELKHLKYLGLRDEFSIADGLRYLENSPSLEYFAISECRLSADSLEALGRNNKIQTLYIRECTDTNMNSQGSFLGDDALEALARGGSKSLTKLSWMRMATPRSGTLQCLKNFPNLKVLKLSWLGLKNSSLKDLLDLNLEILDITSNNEIDVTGLKQLEQMKHLKKLRVGENITERDLREQVPHLKSKIKIIIEPAPAARATEQQFDFDHF